VVAAWAISDRSGTPEAGALIARRTDHGLELTGTAGLVSEGSTAGLFLATAPRAPGEVVQCRVPADAAGIAITPLTGLDLTREFVDVSFNDVRVPAEAVLDADDPRTLLELQIDVAATLGIAESVGAMSRLLEFTVAYA